MKRALLASRAIVIGLIVFYAVVVLIFFRCGRCVVYVFK